MIVRPVLATITVTLVLGCVPFPERVRHTPEVHGVLLADGAPVSQVPVVVESAEDPFSAPPIACGNLGPMYTTDSAGKFDSPAQRHWIGPRLLLGESPEWHRTWRICYLVADSTQHAEWQLLWQGHSNLWLTFDLVCDIRKPWIEGPGWRGRCEAVERPDPV